MAGMDAVKRRLLGDLRGNILEIGAGDGANFAYYRKEVRWLGVEPNTECHHSLKHEAQRYGFRPDVRAYKAERLEVADQSMDAVVSTRVLCSVDSQPQVLAEILRVLKVGGRYVFIEHVGAPPETFKRRTQDLIQPLWGWATGGCHLNRDTAAAIRSAGFVQVEVMELKLAIGILAPHIAGVAVK